MIAIMRKLIHNNVYKIFLWVFLIMMGLGSGLLVFKPEQNKDWVIKAYEKTINAQRFGMMLQRSKQHHEMMKAQGLALNRANVVQETIEAASGNLLLQHAVEHAGFVVSQKHIDREVQKQLQHLPAHLFHANGQLNQEAFLKAFHPYTMEEFVSDVALEAKNEVLHGLLDLSIYIPAYETQLEADAAYAHKKYSYFLLPQSKYIQAARQKSVSDETLKKFYKNPDIENTFRTLEHRSGTVWTFDQHMYAHTVTDADVKSWYDKNKSSLYTLTPSQMQVRRLVIAIQDGKEQDAKARIQEIQQELDVAPDKFEEFVKKMSTDKSSAAKGGLTELFTRGDNKVHRVISDTAFEFLTQDGQISVPVKTDKAYELIQRVKKVPAQYKDFSSVKAEIREKLEIEKFKKRFSQDAGRVVQAARYNPEALNSFVTKNHGIKSVLPLQAIQADQKSRTLFKLSVGKATQFIDGDKGIIILCDNVEKSIVPEFEQVKSKLQSLYLEKEAHNAIKSDLKEVTKLALGTSFDQVAQKYGATVHEAYFKYQDGKIDQSSILKEHGVAKLVQGLGYQGAVVGAFAGPDGIVLRLDSVESVKGSQQELDELKKTAFYTKMYQSKEGFIASLYRIAKLNNKIDIKSEILQNSKEV